VLKSESPKGRIVPTAVPSDSKKEMAVPWRIRWVIVDEVIEWPPTIRRFFTDSSGYSSRVFFFWMRRFFDVDLMWAPCPLTDTQGISVTSKHQKKSNELVRYYHILSHQFIVLHRYRDIFSQVLGICQIWDVIR
jgi:hypothetical protein